jgi:hypothetical protein
MTIPPVSSSPLILLGSLRLAFIALGGTGAGFDQGMDLAGEQIDTGHSAY